MVIMNPEAMEISRVVIYWFCLMILPWLLLATSMFLFAWGVTFDSWKAMVAGILVFLPDALALLFLPLEPLLYITLLLPVFQVIMGIQYYRFEQFLKNGQPEFDESELEDTKKEPS